MSESPVAIGDVIAGKYQVEGTLGRGGMGNVVLARHLKLNRRVAIKFLHRSFAADAEASERFRREARACAQIRSDHVVQLMDVSELPDGSPCMVLEHLDGHTLAVELEQRGSLPVSQVADWMIQACIGLADAHACGVVHRDLKPENLFLTRRADGSSQVKVMDFGISKSLVSGSASNLTLTRTSVIVGSPMYMSPEQLESARQVDVRSDVWSVGVVLHELIGGQMPFAGETIPQLVRSILTQSRTPLTVQNPQLPHEVEAVVAECLAFYREQRFGNVWEVAQALKPFANEVGKALADKVKRVSAGDISNETEGVRLSPLEQFPETGAPGVQPAGNRALGAVTPPPFSVPAHGGPLGGTFPPSTPSAGSNPYRSIVQRPISHGQVRSGRVTQHPVSQPPVGYGAADQYNVRDTHHTVHSQFNASADPNMPPNYAGVGIGSAGSIPPPGKGRGKYWALALGLLVGLAGVGIFFMDGRTLSLSSAPAALSDSLIDIPQARLDSFGQLPSSMPGPENNPTTPEKVNLGQVLFNDPILSERRSMSCASCHPLGNFGMDGHRGSRGNAGQMLDRNTPSVYNVANAVALMWDGRVESLEEQALLPLLNPHEMGMSEKEVISRLSQRPAYVALFTKAFPSSRKPVSIENLAKAFAAFERQLFTVDSNWDRYLNGDPKALTNEQREGFNDFVDAGCPTCHFGPDVGLNLFQKAGLVKAWPNTRDRGRFEVTGRAADFMVFRVPSLRNIHETGPYFHDGSDAELERAVLLMGRHQLGVELSEDKIKRIVAWLGSLTGQIPKKLAEAPALP